MKYLINYIEEAQTKAFEKAGAFFAFSDKQFEEQKKEGVKYSHIGAGLICPKENCKSLVKALGVIHKAGMEQDLKENTKEGVIKRELANHEAYYTGSIESTFDALEPYGITAEEILTVFRKERQLQND